jgi:hypothetical protein
LKEQNLVLVVDESFSMIETNDDYVSRIDFLICQMQNVIAKLKEDQSFNIVAFSDNYCPLSVAGLVPATRENKIKAIKFIRTLNPDGDTYMEKALDAGYKLLASGASDQVKGLYLLSDGQPTNPSATNDVVHKYATLYPKTKLSTTFFGYPDEDQSFMTSLAKKGNDGVTRFVSVQNSCALTNDVIQLVPEATPIDVNQLRAQCQ